MLRRGFSEMTTKLSKKDRTYLASQLNAYDNKGCTEKEKEFSLICEGDPYSFWTDSPISSEQDLSTTTGTHPFTMTSQETATAGMISQGTAGSEMIRYLSPPTSKQGHYDAIRYRISLVVLAETAAEELEKLKEQNSTVLARGQTYKEFVNRQLMDKIWGEGNQHTDGQRIQCIRKLRIGRRWASFSSGVLIGLRDHQDWSSLVPTHLALNSCLASFWVFSAPWHPGCQK